MLLTQSLFQHLAHSLTFGAPGFFFPIGNLLAPPYFAMRSASCSFIISAADFCMERVPQGIRLSDRAITPFANMRCIGSHMRGSDLPLVLPRTRFPPRRLSSARRPSSVDSNDAEGLRRDVVTFKLTSHHLQLQAAACPRRA